MAARARLLPVVRRAEMLGELMRLKWSIAVGGTHGKTTTTSLIAALLDAGAARSDRDQRRHHQRLRHQRAARRRRLDGGRGRRERRHASCACRRPSPSSPTSIPSISTTTARSRRCATPSSSFVENIPFYGFAVLCIDHPEVQALIPRVADRRIITYGFSAAGRRARRSTSGSTASGADFDVVIDRPRDRRSRAPSPTCACRCSASTTCRTRWPPSPSPHEMGIADDDDAPRASPASAASSAASPRPARRDGITVIDDYGHHPVEIAAVLTAARAGRRAAR